MQDEYKDKMENVDNTNVKNDKIHTDKQETTNMNKEEATTSSINLIDTSCIEAESVMKDAGTHLDLAGLHLDYGDMPLNFGAFTPSQLLQVSAGLIKLHTIQIQLIIVVCLVNEYTTFKVSNIMYRLI